jgi:thiamine-monophosphate kinase
MESEFIEWLRSRLPSSPALRLGPGDDAAILRLGDRAECVVTVDMLNDGVDFELSKVEPRRVGRKALAVNLSDLAAMAARPLAIVVAAVLPRQGGKQLAIELFEGMLPLAERYQVAIAGGDTNSWDGPLAISITAIGELTEHGALLRSGARPGDRILVTGAFGGSILGHHFDFEPRVHEALRLQADYTLHAGIDVSDGLTCDLNHICTESRCGAIVDIDQVPVSPAACRLATERADGISSLEHALGDGEDFELILAVPPATARELIDAQPIGAMLTDIGEFTTETGLRQRDANGLISPLIPRGYEHRFNP